MTFSLEEIKKLSVLLDACSFCRTSFTVRPITRLDIGLQANKYSVFFSPSQYC